MRINKVTLRVLAVLGILILLAIPVTNFVSNFISRTNDPFVAPKSQVTTNSIESFYNQELNWRSCYDQFQCSSFSVPIDYQNPKLGKFKIAVMRHLAPNALGNLVINPGGPGGSGVDYVYAYKEAFTSTIRDNFNLIGFDPRGVSRSSPIKCLTNAQTDQSYAESSYPENDSELAKIKSDSEAYAKNCLKNNKYLAYYGTVNAARDMDILRQLLGDGKLNYLGKSYGTYMGTLYAKLFPNKVGRFVLDGAMDPTINSGEQSIQQAVGFDSAFNSFAADCITKEDCVFTKDAVKELANKLAELRTKTLKVGDRKLTESLAMYGIAMGLYDSEQGWPALRIALKNLFTGDASALLALSDAYTGRDSNGNYRDNEVDALTVITCNDFPVTKIDPTVTNKAAPLFGKYVAYGELACNYLPHGKFLQVKDEIALSSQVLVIGTTKDPATPYGWAVALSKILRNSILVTLDSDGHTGYNRGSSCLDQAVEKYLISGQTPAADLTCVA